MAPKKEKVASTKKAIPAEEKYDWSRTQGPDKEDPRTSGPPCHGEHVEALPGKGSVTGSNKYACWTGCQACGLRLSYTPTWGSHGLCRQAGPLHQDTTKQLEEKKPAKGSVDLVNKKIGYDAQERSIMDQLKMVQAKKEEWLKTQSIKDKNFKENESKDNDKGPGKGYTKGKDQGSSSQHQPETSLMSSGPIPKEKTPAVLLAEEMSHTPGRKSRKPEETAEDLEYGQRLTESPESESWSMISGQPGGRTQ